MGKSKQIKEKKFDRNVEISAPILDPEIIKAIHTPPKGQRLDIKNGGFKALLAGLNSQDSTDELTPLNDNHIPSYIGISCAVSGYSNYSPYNKKPEATMKINFEEVRSRTASPNARKLDHQIHHITVDKNNFSSPDAERKELTEKLTASATEHRRSPSPCIPPTEDDRHHGTYVGARYCPLPSPSKTVNKHIPLLGIDDEKNPDEIEDEPNKVEQKIASLYGEEFVEDWRESMAHVVNKELPKIELQEVDSQPVKSHKDLVTLKPTPIIETINDESIIDVQVPDVKVLASIEKEFLTKLLTDDNPPRPPVSPQPPTTIPTDFVAETQKAVTVIEDSSGQESSIISPLILPDLERNESISNEDNKISTSQGREEHIEYEIRANSPVDNESSPIKTIEARVEEASKDVVHDLVSFSPEPIKEYDENETQEQKEPSTDGPIEEEIKDLALLNEQDHIKEQTSTEGKTQNQEFPFNEQTRNDGHHYLILLEEEKSFISKQIEQADGILESQEADLDEDNVGKLRSAIGKANLLINKKCNQFKELCEANINKSSNEQFATLNDDLAGFWDMLNIQFSDVRKSFESLWLLRENNWRDTREEGRQNEEETRTSLEKSSLKPKLSAQKEQERRERLLEHINQIKQSQTAKSTDSSLEES